MNILIKESLEFANSFGLGYADFITNPGKFEGEPRYTPYFWNLTLHSAQDDIEYIDNDVFDIFYVTEDDRKLFPDLIGIDEVAISVDDNGFVYSLLDPVLT